MKAEILQEQLVAGLSKVLHVAASRAQLPILSHVLVEAVADGLVLSATDLELGMRVKLPAKTVEKGKVTLPAKMFFEFLTSLSPGKVELFLEKGSVVATSGTYRATFQTIPAEEFPALPELGVEGRVGSILYKDFCEAADRVVFASARDSLRPVLTGVLLEAGKQLQFVATDGFRLAIHASAISPTKEVSLLVPSRAIAEVGKLGGDGEVIIGHLETSHQVIFQLGDALVVSQLLDGVFPDYGKILPKDFSTTLVVSRDELAQAVSAGYVFARDNSNMLRWEVSEGAIAVSAAAPERGECRVSVPAAVEGEGGEIVFNAKFLQDYLSIDTSERVWFGMNGGTTAGMFMQADEKGKPRGQSKYVVMPINV